MEWQDFNAKQLIGVFEEAEAEIVAFLVCIDISRTCVLSLFFFFKANTIFCSHDRLINCGTSVKA
jgi:hypothetical protein